MHKVIQYLLDEIADSSTLFELDKEIAIEKLATVERNITETAFLTDTDKSILLNAINIVRSLMCYSYLNEVLKNDTDSYQSKTDIENVKKRKHGIPDTGRKIKRVSKIPKKTKE